MPKHELAIQFVNYKTKSYLAKSLRDVLKDLDDTDINHTVYILENGSGENLSELNQERVTITNSDNNLGFGSGHNLLSRQHFADYILILNPDIRFKEDSTVQRLLRSLLETKDGVAIGPKLITESGNQQEWDHGELDSESGKHSPKSFWTKRDDKGEVAWVSGAAMLINGQAYRSIGGFDERFFLYKEEEDLCLRLRKNIGKTYYDPTVSVMHYGSVVANKMNLYFAKSIRYYNKKHKVDD